MDLGVIRIYSFIVIIAAALILILLENIFPYNKKQKFFREGFLNDFILYNFLQSFALGIIISYLIEFIDQDTKLSHLRLIALWPIRLQLIFFIVTHDLYIYWFHRYQHKSKYFWRIHEAHYSTKQVDWLFGTAYFPSGKKAQRYGLGNLHFPGNYFHQHIFAFRKFRKS